MEKEFVPYEVALRLKELGFNEPCPTFYTAKGLLYRSVDFNGYTIDKIYHNECLAPTYSAAFKWFRVTYRYFHSIRIGVNGFTYQISNMFDSSNPDKVFDFGEANIYSSTCTSGEGWYETFEEAELACLEKLMEICSSK